MPRYAQILPDLSLDKTFDYLIPEGMELKPGCRVTIPFGRQQKKGYVLKLLDQTDVPVEKMKAILHNDGHLIPESLMKLGIWIADYYCSGMIQSVRNMLPAPVRKDSVKEKTQKLICFAKDIHPAG